ncbi:hypothetical protein BD560DRAFT_441473 [Blakeslea trispora]|nr:hypothetical protein BD560DRAFT_441473 [Blakeslea trispora]
MTELNQNFEATITDAVVFTNRMTRAASSTSDSPAFVALGHLQDMNQSVILLINETTILEAVSTFRIRGLQDKVLAITVQGTIHAGRTFNPRATPTRSPRLTMRVRSILNIREITNPSIIIQGLAGISPVIQPPSGAGTMYTGIAFNLRTGTTTEFQHQPEAEEAETDIPFQGQPSTSEFHPRPSSTEPTASQSTPMQGTPTPEQGTPTPTPSTTTSIGETSIRDKGKQMAEESPASIEYYRREERSGSSQATIVQRLQDTRLQTVTPTPPPLRRSTRKRPTPSYREIEEEEEEEETVEEEKGLSPTRPSTVVKATKKPKRGKKQVKKV